MKKVIKTCSVNPGLVSIGFMHTAKLSDLILSVKGSNRGLVLLRLAVHSCLLFGTIHEVIGNPCLIFRTPFQLELESISIVALLAPKSSHIIGGNVNTKML